MAEVNFLVKKGLTVPKGSAATPSVIFDASDPNTGIYSPGADQLALSTNGTGRLFVDSTGLVGIGTSSVNALLEVNSSTAGGEVQRIEGNFSGSGSVTLTNWRRSGGAVAAAFKYNDSTTSMSLGTTTSHKLSLRTSDTDALTIDASQRVGIGITGPSTVLHCSATDAILTLQGTRGTGASASIGTGGANSQNFLITAGTDLYYRGASQLFQNVAGTTEYGRWDSSGRLLVGTVSGSYQLQLSTDSAGKPSTNTWTIVSDERIKEEIELADLDLCYEAVKKIPLKRFKWKDEVYTEEQAYDRRKLGWIAQDVEAVFPKAVRQHEFKYNQVFEEVVIPAVPAEVDDDGNIITEEQPERIEKGELISEEVIEDCRDLNSDQLYAAMYGAIQKLISKVETLEAEVVALKG